MDRPETDVSIPHKKHREMTLPFFVIFLGNNEFLVTVTGDAFPLKSFGKSNPGLTWQQPCSFRNRFKCRGENQYRGIEVESVPDRIYQ